MPKPLLVLFLIFIFHYSAKSNDPTNPCVRSQSFHIVILGSSTAAGSGPSSSDSTWVNRYRKFLQGINPQNQVTNLAQGGTTTYHIMPDWYVAPSGRPATNPLRNVSEAMRLQADGIIVNMPSNDAASGFSLSEQMANFILITQVADSAGIPVWVCTTQPRNFIPAKVQLQRDVRDSILSYFGNYAIDFWTGFADSTGQIDSAFDSGDGVHMNDAAHRILFQRVRDKNILSSLIDTLTIPDHTIFSIQNDKLICGEKWDTVAICVANAGTHGGYDLPVKWRVEDLLLSNSNTYWDTIYGGINTCVAKTMKLAVNTSMGGKWKVSASLITVGDSVTSNDFSDTLGIFRKAAPNISALNDTICTGANGILQASGGDSIVWYNTSDSIVGFGPVLNIQSLQTTEFFRASAVLGDLTYKEALFTTNNSSVTFNGIMFDLIAKDSLVIDSLALKAAASGVSGVTAYYVNRSHFGLEDSAQAWSLWGTDTVSPTAADQFCNVSFGSMSLAPGDTLGVYLMMQNGVNLRYLGVSQITGFSTGVLELRSGTGKAYNFGASYFPRTWNGEVFYHYGFNPKGDCHKDTIVAVVVNAGDIQLGADTSIALSQSLLLDIGMGYTSIMWNTGDTASSILIDGNVLGVGQYMYYVNAIDRFGCSVSDTIVIAVGQPLAINGYSTPTFKLYPNPAKAEVRVACDRRLADGQMIVTTTSGRELIAIPLSHNSEDKKVDVSALANGTYYMVLKDFDRVVGHSLLVVHH